MLPKTSFWQVEARHPRLQRWNSVEPCPAPATLVGQRVNNSGFIFEISSARALALSTCFGQYSNFVGLPDLGVNDLTLDSSGNLFVIGYGDPATLVNPIQR